MKHSFWFNKKVLVTGHTGFKGGWLSLWLNNLGANVAGFALQPTVENVFYSSIFKDGFVGNETLADINDYGKLFQFINNIKPEIIFHLAAQPLVRHSYDNPMDTFKTNAFGVINLLEAVKSCGIEPVVINVTTDKVYENNEWIWAYREDEKLGGSDPYSASKACSELITNSYVKSFFNGTAVKIATARAGNVIGGGDMSTDRLVPDYFRSILKNESIKLRNPLATRPWQHVLEPLSGYILLAEKLSQLDGEKFVGAWNFGPLGDAIAVGSVIDKLADISKGQSFVLDDRSNPHEAQSLMLDSAKARKYLDWRPKLSIEEALFLTYDWFSSSMNDTNMRDFSINQIINYEKHE